MAEKKNFAVLVAIFAMLMALQFYYWQSRSLPQPAEDGPVPMDEEALRVRTADGTPFIRFFYTNNCDFSKSMMDVAGRLEAKYPIERINAAKYCWRGKKGLDCPDMVPAFVIYRNGEKFTVYGERSYDLMEKAITQGKDAIAGELNG